MKQITLLVLLIISTIWVYSSEYVTEEELEPGWGLYWTDPWTEYPPDRKNRLAYLSVSPDGRQISFGDDIGFVLYDIEKKEVVYRRPNLSYYDYMSYGSWSTDSKYILNGDAGGMFLLDAETLEKTYIVYDCPTGYEPCGCYNNIGSDNFMHFCGTPKQIEDNFIYLKMDIEKSLNAEKTVYEYDTLFSRRTSYPVFSGNTMDYYINRMRSDSPNRSIDGFYIYKDKKLIDSLLFKSPQEDWELSFKNTWSQITNVNEFALGNDEDAYFQLSFRHKKEIETSGDPAFWDEETLEARDASGLYRVDLSGDSLIQLTRDWTHYNGGISITADGNYIYYGTIGRDTNSVIMRMNKYGKEKEVILNLADIATSIKNSRISPNYRILGDKIIIESENLMNTNCSIIDINGKKIRSVYIDTSRVSISFDGLSPGIFFIDFESSDYKPIKFMVY